MIKLVASDLDGTLLLHKAQSLPEEIDVYKRQLTVLSNRYPATGGGEHMEIVISFLVTVAAGVTCHLICKWLDRHDRDNK